MSPDSPNTTRRALLKTIGATSLAVGATGVASADAPPDLERMEAVHADPLRARWAAAQHADPVLAELADRGVLERGDVTELDFVNADVKGLYRDGTTDVRIAATTEFDGGRIEFVSRPGTGRTYATVRTDDGEVYTVESAAGSDDATVRSCWYEHKCASYMCGIGSYCQYLERECCAGGCTSWRDDGCCSC